MRPSWPRSKSRVPTWRRSPVIRSSPSKLLAVGRRRNHRRLPVPRCRPDCPGRLVRVDARRRGHHPRPGEPSRGAARRAGHRRDADDRQLRDQGRRGNGLRRSCPGGLDRQDGQGERSDKSGCLDAVLPGRRRPDHRSGRVLSLGHRRGPRRRVHLRRGLVARARHLAALPARPLRRRVRRWVRGDRSRSLRARPVPAGASSRRARVRVGGTR